MKIIISKRQGLKFVILFDVVNFVDIPNTENDFFVKVVSIVSF